MANKFFVGRCELDLYIENCHSLKEKRSVVKSIKERLKNQYNIAICEYGDLSLWQRVQLAVVTCSNSKGMVDSTIMKVRDFLDRVHAVSLLNFECDIQ
jgi:uncharacterized protein YlxP (DUF503 family)